MKPAFIAGAHRYFPKAEVVFDYFHRVGEWGKQRSDIRWCKIFLLPFSLQGVFKERKEEPKPLAIP